MSSGERWRLVGKRPRGPRSPAHLRSTTRSSAIAKGILAGAVGTAAMTAHQALRQRLARESEQPQDAERFSVEHSETDPWESAPAPAQVGKRLIERVSGRPVPPEVIPVLTRVMHGPTARPGAACMR